MADREFFRFLLGAFFVHGLVLTSVLVVFPAAPEHYRLDFTFWGQILRTMDIAGFSREPEDVDTRVAIDLPRTDGDSRRIWELAVGSDKEAFQIVRTSPAPTLPPKFTGPRVQVVDNESAASMDIPDVPRIPFRLPRE